MNVTSVTEIYFSPRNGDYNASEGSVREGYGVWSLIFCKEYKVIDTFCEFTSLNEWGIYNNYI